jgi:hypothetical protein
VYKIHHAQLILVVVHANDKKQTRVASVAYLVLVVSQKRAIRTFPFVVIGASREGFANDFGFELPLFRGRERFGEVLRQTRLALLVDEEDEFDRHLWVSLVFFAAPSLSLVMRKKILEEERTAFARVFARLGEICNGPLGKNFSKKTLDSHTDSRAQ